MDLSEDEEDVGVNLNGEGEEDLNGDGQQGSHQDEGQGGFNENENMTYRIRGRNVTPKTCEANEGTTTKSGRRSIKPQPLKLSPIRKRGAFLTQARKKKILSYKQRTPRGQVGTGGWMKGLLHFMDDSRVKMADINKWIRAPTHKWIWEDGRKDEVDEDEEKGDGRMDQEEVEEKEILEDRGRGIGNMQNMQNGDFEHQGVPSPAFTPLPPPLQPVVAPTTNQSDVHHLILSTYPNNGAIISKLYVEFKTRDFS